MFEREHIYKRRDTHAKHGGQQQGGISTPAGKPYILLFTGTGESFGYEDGWVEDGIFLYSGEGQVGDMEFRGGNKAIRDHFKDGKDLHLFKQVGGGDARYIGCFACASWDYQMCKDKAGALRRAIVFQLFPLDSGSIPSSPGSETSTPPATIPLDELRRKALEAASAIISKAPKEAKRHLYERSEIVRAYVLARANGTCESCEKPAPFRRPDGTAYLEPHHTLRVSDFGPDHPRWVGGICPNCHREIHYGVDGDALNRRLQEHLRRLEEDGG